MIPYGIMTKSRKEVAKRYYDTKVKPFDKNKQPATKRLRFICPMCGLMINLKRFEREHRIKLVWNYYLGRGRLVFEEITDPNEHTKLFALFLQQARVFFEKFGYAIKPITASEIKIKPAFEFETKSYGTDVSKGFEFETNSSGISIPTIFELNPKTEVENG